MIIHMKKELAKIYEASQVEGAIYQKWLESGFFNPDNLDLAEDAPSYTIILPPPNITARLHVGHSMMIAIEDLLIRYKRQNGYRALWVPGTDHAAIATQNVVERLLIEKEGKNRHDLGRVEFLNRVNSFVNKTQGIILEQIKKMGASLDWSRLAFTLDEKRKKSVERCFIDMYNEGVIYRGERIVNWCPKCSSTLADDELEYQEQKAKLYTFKYSADFPIAISSTRPETKLADTALAVHPNDKRYSKYIGKEYSINFCGIDLSIKIIADHQVDMNLGTGALGITPAHSMTDWMLAEKHNLEKIKLIDESGKIKEGFGEFSGLSSLDAREKVLDRLRKDNLLIKEEEIENNLSTCYRCGMAIEPLPSKQWFVAVDKGISRLNGKSLKEASLELVRSGEIKFYPERFTKQYLDWMDNLHDWCISRQIWFGHSIPAWFKGDEFLVSNKDMSKEGWLKDQDTLDTWFSSSLWTFSVLGWPENFKDGKKLNDLARFHPSQVMETGYEIMTLWVSRMIMMSLFNLGEKPFSQVYLHGMILDKDGKKMSKSKGNGIDPLELVEKYGSDALRLSLLMGSTPGNDSRYSIEKIESKRNFINKLWNISRFILSKLEQEDLDLAIDSWPKPRSLADYWILKELEFLIQSHKKLIDTLDFSEAADNLLDFTWSKLADWYLEISKVETEKEEILVFILKNLLILWHPFIPFISEEIWQSFSDSLLINTQSPQLGSFDNKDYNLEDFKFLQSVVIAIRNARSENKIEPATKMELLVNGEKSHLLLNNSEILMRLKTNLSSVQETKEAPKENSIKIALEGNELYLLGGIDKEKELKRLQKERENLKKLINNLDNNLQNKDFIKKAPAQLVEAQKAKKFKFLTDLKKVEDSLEDIKL